MCVVVPTRNNAYNHRYVYNLQSILNQNYTNYKIVIIDDHSDDGTGVLIQKYLRRHNVPP
jgi:glycosyltransferase involved in cell wall biosynthesis